MRQANKSPASLYEVWGLIKELQRKLDVSCRLRALNEASGRGLNRGVRYGQIHAVKHIQEVRAELHFEAFRNVEVLLDAGVPVVVTRAAQVTKLRCASAEADSISVVGWVKPLESATWVCRG